jgi:hypothetical protein
LIDARSSRSVLLAGLDGTGLGQCGPGQPALRAAGVPDGLAGRRERECAGGELQTSKTPHCEAASGAFLVGRTGFEPVTFSVSGRRAPAAPTARDDESLPDSGSGGVHHGELRRRLSRYSRTSSYLRSISPSAVVHDRLGGGRFGARYLRTAPPTQASIRGSPNRAMLLLSTNRVTAEIRSPDSVSTIIPCARNTWAWSSCR